jgi:alpha-beta hydrolase superfamily lysophospholipase
MQTAEWTFNAEDGVQLVGRSWAPEGTPKALICLVHGLGEHAGRYEHVAEAFTKAGYAMTGFDLRGHGRSGGPRGHTPSFEMFMRDIDIYLDEGRKRFPDLPRFIYGHSLGGILVLNYVLRRKPDFKGVVVTDAGLRTALEKQKAKVLMAKVLGSILPTVTLNSGLDPATISRDPAVVQRYVDDPLVHYQLSFGMGRETLQAIRYAFEHAAEISLPLLMMHGTADQLGFKEGSQEFAALAPGDVTLKLWDGLYHEIHNEPEQAEVFEFTIDWLNNHLK